MLVRSIVAATPGYEPGEQPTDTSIIKLNTNENPYPPSHAVRQAIIEATEKLHLYPDPSARELRECVASLYGCDPAGVVVGNGSDEILALLVRTVLDPGAAVAFPTPTYSLYETIVRFHGARSIQVPFPSDYRLPTELFSCEAKLFFLCSPNSPSGTVLPLDSIRQLAVDRPESIVVVDEAYADFAESCAVGLVGSLPNLLVVRTLSKSYSLAGLRLGLALAPPALARELNKVKDSYNVSRLAQAGALAALRDQVTFRTHIQSVRATRERLTGELRTLGFTVLDSKANFVLAKRSGEPLGELADRLKREKILVRHFAALPDSLRISIGTDQQIDALLGALRRILPPS